MDMLHSSRRSKRDHMNESSLSVFGGAEQVLCTMDRRIPVRQHYFCRLDWEK